MFGVNQGAEPPLFHAMGHDAAGVTCQLPAQQFRPGRQGKGDTGGEGHRGGDSPGV